MKVLDLLVFIVNNRYEWMHFSLDDYLEVFEISLFIFSVKKNNKKMFDR